MLFPSWYRIGPFSIGVGVALKIGLVGHPQYPILVQGGARGQKRTKDSYESRVAKRRYFKATFQWRKFLNTENIEEKPVSFLIRSVSIAVPEESVPGRPVHRIFLF